MADAPGDAAGLAAHPDFAAAAPSPDHFIPLLYLAGLAGAAGEGAAAFIEGYAYGSLSMTAYGLGIVPSLGAAPATEPDGNTAPLLPDPDAVPPDETNA
jgi:4,5-DOPA dioxygenase extradiol